MESSEMNLRDLEIADDILKIVDEEVTAIKNATSREVADIIRLEKISKIYTTLMANQREVLKSGVLGSLKLDESDNGGDSEDDTEDDT
jgi:hypothetical protein